MICASRHTVLYYTSACQCMTGYWGGECRDKCGNCFREWFWRRTHPLPSAIGGAAWKWTATWHDMIHFQQRISVAVWWVYKLRFEAAWWIIFCFHQWMLLRTLACSWNDCVTERWVFPKHRESWSQAQESIAALLVEAGCNLVIATRGNFDYYWTICLPHKVLFFLINATTVDHCCNIVLFDISSQCLLNMGT